MLTKDIVNIESGTLFRLIIIGYAGIFIPVTIISGVLSLFELVPTIFNNENYFGVEGLIIAIVAAPFYLLLMSGATWIFLIIGLRSSKFFYNMFRQN